MKTEKTVKIDLTLECKLTEKELKDCSKKLAEAISRKTTIEDDIVTYKAQKKGELQEKEGTIKTMSEKVNSEKDWRSVQCEVFYDFGSGIKKYVRLDTGEEIKVENINAFERQQELEFKKKQKQTKKKVEKKAV